MPTSDTTETLFLNSGQVKYQLKDSRLYKTRMLSIIESILLDLLSGELFTPDGHVLVSMGPITRRILNDFIDLLEREFPVVSAGNKRQITGCLFEEIEEGSITLTIHAMTGSTTFLEFDLPYNTLVSECHT